ncbi:MAG: tyrosine-type recombinase/integrase [Deltaproteobacteria bacterium]|nr:tyrosine-type recombinase/integrase [Deltaproteobacteria bacterium]
MTVKVRPYKRGGWEVDIMLTIPGRPRIRDRKKAPVSTKSAAKRWGEERERQLIQHYTNTDPSGGGDDSRPDVTTKEVPTLAKFLPRYIEGHCKANRLRPATMDQKERSFRVHLLPAFGRTRLDRITAEDIQKFKGARSHLKHSTVNLHLKHLRSLLNIAMEWGVIDRLPTKIKKLKEATPDFKFYDFDDFDRIVLAAEQRGMPNVLLTVLMGGEAGLRSSEMQGLQWSDIDLKRDTLRVRRGVWRGQEGPTKGNRSRTIPLAERLSAALAKHRHLRSPYVLCTQYGTRPAHSAVRDWLNASQQNAGFELSGPHMLRHTFCSHLAMKGTPARAIQELAGHESITTTQRYMHLAPAAARDAIDGLRRPPNWRNVGDGPRSVIRI